jgi:acyl dehydratase
VSFVHVAVTDGDENPLTASPAFAAFQADIGERCAEGPTPADATVIGNFRLLG